jgi:hypothetical protein
MEAQRSPYASEPSPGSALGRPVVKKVSIKLSLCCPLQRSDKLSI